MLIELPKPKLYITNPIYQRKHCNPCKLMFKNCNMIVSNKKSNNNNKRFIFQKKNNQGNNSNPSNSRNAENKGFKRHERASSKKKGAILRLIALSTML